ncbi:copper-binding protein [Herbaspirillum sp. ST 5-3]|uniref:copper-binding protein n=1 Tax=Oxalobacteraceae TaxID=75682 RepID=UPI0010A3F22F|nr:copper-binding protein [Herbaspirillum sp. ST 5-3]
MKHSLNKTTAAFGIALFALAVHAEQSTGTKGMDMGNMKMDSMEMNSSKAMSRAMNEGEVIAVDKAGKSVTIKHGPLKSKTVEMGPMTMSFPVQHASLLSNVKVGDTVKLTVENVKNVATVTALKPKK